MQKKGKEKEKKKGLHEEALTLQRQMDTTCSSEPIGGTLRH